MVPRFPGIIVAVMIFFQGTVALWANETLVKSVGKTIQPVHNVPVRMVSEVVRISLNSAKANVHCRFTLRNEESRIPLKWDSRAAGKATS